MLMCLDYILLKWREGHYTVENIQTDSILMQSYDKMLEEGGERLIVLYVKSWQVICAFCCPFQHKLQNNDMVVFKLFKHISRPSNQSGIFFLAVAFLHSPVLHSLFFFSLSALRPEPQMIFRGFIVPQREKWDRCALIQYTYGWTQVTDWSDLFINAANSSWEITWSVWTVVLKIGESQKYLTQKYSHRL